LVSDIIIVDEIKINEADLKYTILDVRHNAHALLVELEYGGGCIDPHVFELISDAEINKDGIVDMWLLHKTHDDLCKALIKRQLVFDISYITTLKSKKLKAIRFNNDKVFTLSK
jgi:hypothetical protein